MAERSSGRKLEREFYQDLLRVIQKWERTFAALDESEQRRRAVC
jgi:hypothetical protein